MATGVQIAYGEPTNPAHRPIYERLQKRQVLEHYKEFMSPLMLKTPLQVALQSCGGKINAWFDGSAKITYCYELVAELERVVATAEQLPNFRREDALLGAFVQILLHETSHAMFAYLDIPVFGREEDAADALAEFVLLQLGHNTARRTLTGTAFFWRAWEIEREKGRSRKLEDFSDEHGTHGQRFYNALCIAHGYDLTEGTKVFEDFIKNKLLPEDRAGHCAREYYHAKNSFTRLVMPHVDPAKMKQVQSVEWLRSDDGTDVLPPTLPAGGPPTSGPTGPTMTPTNPGPTGPSGPSNPGRGPAGPPPGTPAPGSPRR